MSAHIVHITVYVDLSYKGDALYIWTYNTNR